MKSILLFVLAAFMLTSEAYAINICKNGKPQAVIVLGSQCIPSERTAAKELAKYLKQITGADYPVMVESGALKAKQTRIYVGQSKQADKLLNSLDWQKLGKDGIVIKTTANALVLTGSRPRGALYAVYSFLEDTLGCRWWTSVVSDIPKKKNINVTGLNRVYVPRMIYRESHYRQTYNMQHPDFAVKQKCNGVMQQTPDEWGGHLSFINGGHSFGKLIAADTYFKDHPEWFSLVGNVRIPNGQLCLSNKEMRKEITKNTLASIAEYPNCNIVDVSQNDNYGYCQCPECTALADKYGGQSGLVVDFINEIAAEVAKQYPDQLVQTFAYQYTRFAPKNIKPAKNVIIRLCSIENDNSKPLTSPTNADFYNALKEWRKLTDRLFIWDYAANFSNYHIPHPNTQVLERNIKLYVDAGAIGMFEQGDMYNNSVCFSEMRNWVVSKLLWDQTLDGEKLIDAFMTGYYGKAANTLKEILAVYTDSVLKANYRLTCYNDKNPYFTAQDYITAFGLFDKAESLVDSQQIKDRILVQRRGLELALLLSDRSIQAEVKKKGSPRIGDVGDWCKEYLNWTAKSDNTFISEGRPISMHYFIAWGIYSGDRGKTPENLKGIGDKDWFGFQDNGFILAGEGTWAFREADAKASDGSAARMPCDHKEWATAMPLTSLIDNGLNRGEIFIRLRKSDAGSPAGFSSGIYDVVERKEIMSASFEDSQISTEHKDFSLGVQAFSGNGMQLWIAPKNLGNKNSIYIDRVYVVKEGAVPATN